VIERCRSVTTTDRHVLLPNHHPRVREDPFVRTQIKPDTRLLTPAEVAAMLRVDPKTVTRWARGGKLSSIRTPGGHRRYSENEVRGFLNGWQGVSLPRAGE
jgi:excisionase family DNA binding protein